MASRKFRFVRFWSSDRFILTIIILNAITIFFEQTYEYHTALYAIDVCCTLVFLVEMVVKHYRLGFKKYWSDSWNRLDGILVLLSLPSVLMLLLPFKMMDLSVFLIIRMLRVTKMFKVVHFFPRFSSIMNNFKLAMDRSYGILLCFLVLIVISGMINCSLFKDLAPQYFATPLDSIYSVFRLFTVEGWYEIPDAITIAISPVWGKIVRLYFCILLLLGGILGMSFINSIFVDAMVSDNNDDVKAQLAEMEKKIDKLLEEKELKNKHKS